MTVEILIGVAVVLGIAVLNHIRGGGALFRLDGFLLALPGRSSLYCLPFVFLCGLAAWSWAWALYFTAAWLLWASPPWGRWFRLNRMDRTRSSGPPSRFEKLVELIGGNSDYACFTIRNTLCVLPLAVLSPWLVLLGPAQTGAYEISLRAGRDIAGGEILTGALWGAAIIAVRMLS